MLGACSFQKEPNKTAKVVETPKEVKVGMTKEEIREHLSKPEAGALPDRLQFALKAEDMGLALKIVVDADSSSLEEYGSEGITALDFALRSDAEELAMLLLEKGASPYRLRKGSTTRIIEANKKKIEEHSSIRALVDQAGKKLYEEGLQFAAASIGGLLDFSLRTGYPLTSKEYGVNSILETFGREIGKDTFFKFKSEKSRNGDCSFAVEEILEYVRKTEGPENIPWNTFFDASVNMNSLLLADYTGPKAGKKSSDYVAFLRKIEKEGYKGMRNVQKFFGSELISDEMMEVSLMNYIQAAEETELVDLIYDETFRKEIFDRFPNAYRELYEKVGHVQVEEAEEVFGEGELPGGKIGAARDLYDLQMKGENVELRCE